MSGPVPVPPPPQEQRAVTLSGQGTNPAPEAWENIESTGPSPGVASFDGPELRVRNVSRATLTFFPADPGKATGAAMIVAPGGAYMQLAMEREGYAVARWFQQRGIAGFVLKYRVAATPADPQQAEQFLERSWPPRLEPKKEAHGWVASHLTDLSSSPQLRETMLAAREDGFEAVRYVRTHAQQLHLDPNRIGFIGFSAGAVIALDVALRANAASRPDLVAAIYGALPDENAAVPPGAPPVFIASASDDVYPWSFSLATYSAWRAAGVSAEVHVFEDGGHGFGMLHQGKSTDQWSGLLDSWLRSHRFTAMLDPRARSTAINGGR